MCVHMKNFTIIKHVLISPQEEKPVLFNCEVQYMPI